MKKIVIIGNTGSGKTTLANKVGALLHIPVHHLDKIFWTEEKGIKQDVFIAQQEEIMKRDSWIIDGNFMRSKSFDLRLEKADTIIFLDFPKPVVYFRYLKRYIQYFNKVRPDMAGQKGSFDWHSLKFIWNYPTKEIRAKVMEYATTKKVITLHSKKDEKVFLKEMK